MTGEGSSEKSTETEFRGPEGQLVGRLVPGTAGSIYSGAGLLSKGCLGVPLSSLSQPPQRAELLAEEEVPSTLCIAECYDLSRHWPAF